MGSSMTQAEAASHGIKLRESCDACLTAKVKCSKGRPVCQRCLTNGSECAYSPSARAGRKNRNSTGGVKKSGSTTASHQRPKSIDLPKSALHPSTTTTWPPYPSSYDTSHPILDQSNSNTFNTSIAPNTSTSTAQPYSGRTPSLTSDDEALDGNLGQHGAPLTPDKDDNGFSAMLATPPSHQTEFQNVFGQYDEGLSATSMSFADYDMSLSLSQSLGTDYIPPNHPSYLEQPLPNGNLQTSFVDLPPLSPPASKPQIQNNFKGPLQSRHPNIPGEGCDCFADCVQSLNELHVSSFSSSPDSQAGPKFDIILAVNNAATSASNKMVACDVCSTKSGIAIATMLIATMLGKVLSLYRTAAKNRFGSSREQQTHASLAFGAYQISADDRELLELEILLFELNKVEKTMCLWRERSQQAPTDKDAISVYKALSHYLDKSLHQVTGFLRDRRVELCK